jgi:hypothetical protein
MQSFAYSLWLQGNLNPDTEFLFFSTRSLNPTGRRGGQKNTRTPWSTVNRYRFRKLSRGWLREGTVRMRARIFVTSLVCTAALVSIQSFAQTPAGNGLRDPPTFVWDVIQLLARKKYLGN